jgi:drug/metabolite transporter (DMT)-like permease
VAAILALVSAMCFALAAALQQRGQFAPANAGSAVRGLAGLFRLVAVPVWLFGTLILLVGYATQGIALGRGRLVVVQPLTVTTVVWALPLGCWLTSQQVVRRQAAAALLAALGGAVLITLANRETQLPGEPTGGYGALTDETLR